LPASAGPRHPALALIRSLSLEPLEHGLDAFVERHGLCDLDLQDPVLHADGKRLNRKDGGKRERPPAADVDVRAVPRADGVALVEIEVALAERAVVVRAAILDRV